jgi:hypothetical protein
MASIFIVRTAYGACLGKGMNLLLLLKRMLHQEPLLDISYHYSKFLYNGPPMGRQPNFTLSKNQKPSAEMPMV